MQDESIGKWQQPVFKVKFMHRGLRRGRSADKFLRQFPNNFPQWDKCIFDFDIDNRDYDWLVVYHDLPKDNNHFFSEELLNCPKEKTVLLTGEPSTITVFGSDYLKQFGSILTFQEPWVIKHPNTFFHHPGLMWHYGLSFSGKKHITWNQMAATTPPQKTELLSTVCSSRTGKITLHSARVAFTKKLKKDIPTLDIYGHGVNPMDDKLSALQPYKYHIAVENHVFQHHITEKLPDAFLGFTLPFYHGAPNAEEYFPSESFIPIDINDYKRSKEIIAYHMANNEYNDRLPYIREARRRVLEEQNLFSIINNHITTFNKQVTTTTMNRKIQKRATLRIKNPIAGIRSLAERLVVKSYHVSKSCYKNIPELKLSSKQTLSHKV